MMIHVMLPTQYLRRAGAFRTDPHKRLMAAVLQTVVDDCRGGQAAKASAYLDSTDRTWPFSFENLCEALGLSAGCLREELQKARSV